MKLTNQERDVILAALRHWQTEPPTYDELLMDIATNSGQHVVLGMEGIDELCERLNK